MKKLYALADAFFTWQHKGYSSLNDYLKKNQNTAIVVDCEKIIE